MIIIIIISSCFVISRIISSCTGQTTPRQTTSRTKRFRTHVSFSILEINKQSRGQKNKKVPCFNKFIRTTCSSTKAKQPWTKTKYNCSMVLIFCQRSKWSKHRFTLRHKHERKLNKLSKHDLIHNSRLAVSSVYLAVRMLSRQRALSNLTVCILTKWTMSGERA